MKQIKFDSEYSYDDLGLKLLDYTIDPPKLKKIQVALPGADGVLDMSEWMGYPVYDDRDASFVFDLQADNMVQMEKKLSVIYASLNGTQKRISIGDGYYYTGRMDISTERIDTLFRSVTLDCELQPYKLKESDTVISKVLGAGNNELMLHNEFMPVVPVVKTTGTVKIVFGNGSYTVAVGEHIVPGLRLNAGTNKLVLTGTGTVTFTYREGRF